MVDSMDELKSSRSVAGKNFPNFEMLDAKITDRCFEQDHRKLPLQEEGQSRGTESQKRGSVSTRKTDRLHDLRLFRVTSAHDIFLITLIYSLSLFVMIMFRISIKDGRNFIIYYQDPVG